MTDASHRIAPVAPGDDISMSALLAECRVPTSVVPEFTAAFNDMASRFGCDNCEILVTYTSKGGKRT